MNPRCPRCGDLPDVPAPTCRRCGASPGASPASAPPGLLAALGVPFLGARCVRRHPRLLPWVLLPLAVDLLLLALLVLAAWNWAPGLAPDLSSPWPGWIDWLRGPIAWGMENLLRLLAVLAAFYATTAVAGTVNAPLYDLLSEKTEDLRLGVPDPGRPWAKFLADGARAASGAALVLLFQIAVLFPLFVLSFTAVGAPFFAAAGAWFAGFALMDIPLARKRYTGTERVGRGLRRFGRTLATGALVSVIPPLQPLAVVGATLLYLEEPER